ncbi:MAG: alpha/beta hydrolase [Austwickia sp.]|nr:MAG: alpha/beta hydrolase [Austwickia sp.]
MQETLVEVPGGRIAVQSYGGSGRDVLFLHGVGFCGPQWRAFAETVSDRCRPFSLDLPGHAHSTVPMRSADDSWRHLATAARGAGLDRPFLVAHDTSIWAAVVAAIKEPDAFSGLMLVGGTMTRIAQSVPLAEDPHFERLLRERFRLGETGLGRDSAETFQHEMVATAARDWMLTDLGAGYYDEVGHSLVFGPDDTWMNTPTASTVLAAQRVDRDHEYYPDVDLYTRLTVPTWFVFLEHGFDSNVDLNHAPLAEAKHMRLRRLDAGQFPQYTDVAALAEVLTEALAD